MDGSPFLLCVLTLVQLSSLIVRDGDCAAVDVTLQNFDQYRTSSDILLLNFYADWCRFSQMLKPVFDKAADTLQNEFPGRVMLGKVNCEREKNLCNSPFHITKYPTLKLIRHGAVARKEYRGQRSADALAEYVRNQLTSPIELINDYFELSAKEVKRAAVGFFPSNQTVEYINFAKAAINLRDDCPFYALLGQDKTQIIFKQDESPDKVFNGDSQQFLHMLQWIHEHCVPLVREITFENGEEMTEEGLPLLILFYHPDHTEIKEVFKQRVEAELQQHKGTVNPVTANGVMFAHPLHHLGKHKNDLPVLAIDSFRHMYLFPNFDEIHVEGKINQFITDLHSGKLHKDFHNPPPPSTNQHTQPPQTDQVQKRAADANPPESTFRKLQPAQSRYSFRARDEL